MSAEPEPSRPIVIFDSGIGGLPYLETAREAMPRERFIYLADRAGFPYGVKGRDEVRARVVRLIGLLVELHRPKAVVIACNTASQAGLEVARAAFPGLPIVGTVPAVKPAAERTRSRTIAVMATAGAVEDPYLDSLVASHARGVRVLRAAAQELVAFVERRAAAADAEERREAVSPFVLPLVEAGADEIVLACTHFLHLRDDIAAVAGEGVEVVDSRAGVVARLRDVLAAGGALDPGGAAPPRESLFLLTGEAPAEAEYRLLALPFGLAGPYTQEPGGRAFAGEPMAPAPAAGVLPAARA